ncbi:hypothetical protein HS088_TW10G00086 [Tripterygium wilfordii]|uniref:Cyclin-dependent protein kinase inhibitor SMR6-like n=1 Tax=Tripterygium wilfordii TaxID=458696 RepID=A0A7J7D441_TRIWF|nr:cyclin-dependent protein kinase inhibitor SMR6-like [Tripterygium wilfordii]KAF5741091.1 hypothetical protein HS088_TW10G00086 [Tripterygium wilfordii]
MGYAEKNQVGGGLELEDKKWVIAGIPLRAPLKQIYTNPMETERESGECSTTTTPTGEEARIPSRLVCPPPPRKKKPSLKCNYGVREFFTPPDLETVFIRRAC